MRPPVDDFSRDRSWQRRRRLESGGRGSHCLTQKIRKDQQRSAKTRKDQHNMSLCRFDLARSRLLGFLQVFGVRGFHVALSWSILLCHVLIWFSITLLGSHWPTQPSCNMFSPLAQLAFGCFTRLGTFSWRWSGAWFLRSPRSGLQWTGLCAFTIRGPYG